MPVDEKQDDDTPALSDLPRRFWAFISYSREDNRPERRGPQGQPSVAWGDWVQEELETYSVPEELVGNRNFFGEVLPERAFPVFRDEEDMGASGSLPNSVRRALETRPVAMPCGDLLSALRSEPLGE